MPRRGTRKNRIMYRKRRGGAAYVYEPAPVGYENKAPMQLSLGQGQQFAQMHVNQHGGFEAGPYPGSVTNSSLPAELVASARLQPLNAAFQEIAGLKDANQAGGRRRKNRKSRRKSRKSRKSKKGTRKGGAKKSRKNRKSRKSKKSRKDRRRRGGALGFQEINAPGMLLSENMYKEAGLNPEWELAKDPNAFAPVAPRS